MTTLRDEARWIVDQIDQAMAMAKALGKPQLATSSIEGGKIEEYDRDGTLVQVIGEQHDGTHTTATVGGPVPPEPVPASVTVGAGSAEIRWNGKFADDALSPMDLSHVSAHASRLEVFSPDNTTQKATITGETGDLATVLLEPGAWTIGLVAVSKSGKWSPMSETVTVEILDYPSPVDIQDSLIELDEKYDGVITEAGNLGDRLDLAESDLEAHGGRLDANDATLTTLTGTTLPALDAELAAAKATLAPLPALIDGNTTKINEAKGRLDTLDSTTLPGLSTDLANAKTRLSTAEATLADNQTKLNTTLPNSISAAKAAADMALLIAPVSTSAPVLADGTGRPIGAIWTRIDGSGNEIGYWRWTASGWVVQTLSTTVIPNLSASKITSGTIAAARIDVAALAVSLATIIELNADRITAGKITAGQIDTPNLAASLATILQLNADRITAGTISAARLDITDLSARIATVIQLNADRITAGTINTARLNVSEIAAQVATVIQLNADRITAGTVNTARLNATEIAAATAAFQTVDVKNLFATTGTMSEAVITKLFTDVVMSRKITAEMMAIGSFDNLNVDPKLEIDSAWTGIAAGSGSGFVTTPLSPDKPSRVTLMTPKTAQSNMALYNYAQTGPNRVQVTPGDHYVAWSYVQSDVPDATMTSVSQRLYFYDAAGAILPGPGNSDGGSVYPATWVPGQWIKVGGKPVEVPAGAVAMSTRLTVYSPTNSAPTPTKYWVGPPHINRAVGGTLLVDGAVKAVKIDTVDLAANTGFIAELTAKIIKADTFEGKTFTGGTFSGSVVSAIASDGTGVIISPFSRNGQVGGSVDLTFDDPLWIPGFIRATRYSLSGTLTPSTEIFSPKKTTNSVASYIRMYEGDGGTPGSLINAGTQRVGGFWISNAAKVDVSAGSSPASYVNFHKATTLASQFTLTLAGHRIGDGTAGSSYTDFVLGDDGTPRVYSMAVHGREYTKAANMFITEAGTLGRSTSKRANKLVIENLRDVDDQLLSLDTKTWFDRTESEQVAQYFTGIANGDTVDDEVGKPLVDMPNMLRRVPGLVAEDVEAAGLTEFVQYGTDGQVEGLMYDRLGVALIPVVARLRDRIIQLEERFIP